MTTEPAPASTSLRTERASEDVVRLTGSWLVVAHTVWASVLVLCLVLAIAGIFVHFQVDRQPCESNPARPTWQMCEAWQAASIEMGISLGFTGAFFLFLRIVATLPYFALAVLMVVRRPIELRILLLSVLLAVQGATGTWYVPLFDWAQFVYPLLYRPSQLVNALLYCGFLFGYLFPDGRFVPRWTRRMALLIVPLAFGAGFFIDTALDYRTWPVPFPQALNLTLAGTSVYAIVYRYRYVARSLQRQQIKWLVSGFSLLFFLWFLDLAVLDLYPAATGNTFPFPTMRHWVARDLLQQLAWYVAQLLFAIALGVSVFRYRLYDIDVIIHRTLVYTLLSTALALIYLGSVVVLERLLAPLAGESNQLAVVASTLAIVALFQPLRRRIQATIDRRFYRRKYDAAKTLQAFNARVRDQVELSTLTDDVLDTVQDTLQPAHVSLWLRPTARH